MGSSWKGRWPGVLVGRDLPEVGKEATSKVVPFMEILDGLCLVAQGT